MQVIFTQNVKGVASKGDLKKVADGFFRNFLLPRSLAVRATDNALSQWEKVRETLMIERQQLKEKSEEIKKRLAEMTIKLTKKVTKAGKLYGGIHQKDIVDVIKDQLKIELPEEAVQLGHAIKDAGDYEIELVLSEGVTAKLKLEITAA